MRDGIEVAVKVAEGDGDGDGDGDGGPLVLVGVCVGVLHAVNKTTDKNKNQVFFTFLSSLRMIHCFKDFKISSALSTLMIFSATICAAVASERD